MFSAAEQIVGRQKMVGIAPSQSQNLQNVGLRMKKWRRNIGRIDMFVLNPSGAGDCGCSKAEQLRSSAR